MSEAPLREIFRYPIATAWLPESIFTTLAEKTSLVASTITRFENGLIECNNFKIMLEVVRHSEAVGCGLAVIFSQALSAGDVVLPIVSGGLSTQNQLVHLKRYSASPAVEVFRSFLLETLQRE
jgi:DNA-binding transcriptional LysR family regulator